MNGLRLENISKSYDEGARALSIIKNLSWVFPPSGSVAIIGRSGIGKSTLLHLMGGLDTPTSGTISCGDEVLTTKTQDELALFRRKNVGFVFQFHHLLPEFTAAENVALPLRLQGQTSEASMKKAEFYLERVGLTSRKHHRPSELSGGEQSRVALARAIIHEPKIILADEPTGSLDLSTGKEIRELLFGVQKEFNALLVVVTHHKEVASQAEQILEMSEGGGLAKP